MPLSSPASLIIGSLAIYGCTSVESVTISNISQADSSQKTKIEVVLDGEVDKTQIAEFVESFGTAVTEGETLTFMTPTHTPLPHPTRIPRPTSSTVGNRTNPVPYGEQYLFETRDNGLIAVSVSRVIRDKDGSEYRWAKENYLFGPNEPPDDHAYIIVELHLEYLEGPEDESYTTSSGSHRFYGGNRLWGAPTGSLGGTWLPSVAEDEDLISGHDIFPGASVTGWLPPKYMLIEFLDEALLVYSDVYFELADVTETEDTDNTGTEDTEDEEG